MPHMRLADMQQPDIDRPTCEGCGAQMWLAGVAPSGRGKEHRKFECPVCDISTGNSEILKRRNSIRY